MNLEREGVDRSMKWAQTAVENVSMSTENYRSVHSDSSASTASGEVKKQDSSALSMFMDFFQPLPAQNDKLRAISTSENESAISSSENDSVSTNTSVDEDAMKTTQQSKTVELDGSIKENEALSQSIDNTIINAFKEDDLGLQSMSWYNYLFVLALYIYIYIYISIDTICVYLVG
jgi:hypothetical protein